MRNMTLSLLYYAVCELVNPNLKIANWKIEILFFVWYSTIIDITQQKMNEMFFLGIKVDLLN